MMLAVMFIALTATGIAMFAISQRTKIGTRLWEFNLINLESKEKLQFHVRSNDYSDALQSAIEARRLHAVEEYGYFTFDEIYELNPKDNSRISRVWKRNKSKVKTTVSEIA